MIKNKNPKEHQKYKSFSIDVMSLMSGQLVIAIISFVSSIVMARALGVEGRGYFVMAILLPNILFSFSDFGFSDATTKFVASKKWLASTVFVTNTIVIFIRLIVIGILGAIIIHFYSETFFPGIPKQYLYLGLLQVVGLVIQSMILPIFLGLGQGIRYGLILVFSSAFSLLILTGGWFTIGLTVTLALAFTIGSSAIIAVYIYFSVLQHIGEVGNGSRKYLKESLQFGSGIYVSIVSSFANEKLVLLILNLFGGVVFVSLYAMAQALTEKIYMLSDAVGTMLMPKVADDPEHNSYMLTPIVFKITVIITIMVSGVLMISADWLVTFIYGSEFSGSIEIMKILLVAVIFSSGWRILWQDLNARGFTKQTAIINVSLTIISLTLAAILLPLIGLKGAAWGSIFAYIFALIFGILFFVKKTSGMTTWMLFSFSRSEKKMLMDELQQNSQVIKIKSYVTKTLSNIF